MNTVPRDPPENNPIPLAGRYVPIEQFPDHVAAEEYLLAASSDELDVAHGLVSLLAGPNGLVFDRGTFRLWGTSKPGWRRLPEEVLRRCVLALHGKPAVPGPNLPSQLASLSTIRIDARREKAITGLVAGLSARPGFFDDQTTGAGFDCGLVTFKDGGLVLEPHHPDHRLFSEQIRPYGYIADMDTAKPTELIGFLKATWAGCPDWKERLRFVFEYVGVAMLGRATDYKDNPVFEGPKDSGKSTLLDAVASAFPSDVVGAVPLHDMGSRFGGYPLLTASINIVAELSRAGVKASERAKALLVGDRVMFERKYMDPFEARSGAGHIYAANELPKIADSALRDRFVVIDCPNVVAEEDKDRGLAERLALEAPEIASFALHAAARGVLRRGRFLRPSSSVEQGRRWAAEIDCVAEWAEDYIEPGSTFERTQNLHDSYVVWAQARGREVIGQQALGRRLAALGFVKKNRRGSRGFLVKHRAGRPESGDLDE